MTRGDLGKQRHRSEGSSLKTWWGQSRRTNVKAQGGIGGASQPLIKMGFTQVCLVCRATEDQDGSGSGGCRGSRRHHAACSLPVPHLLHVSWGGCGPEVADREPDGS